MGSSFVEFRGRGFWSRDVPLQVAMFGLASAIEGSAGSNEALSTWREKLREQMVWGGNGCVWVGTEDLPQSLSSQLLADIVRRAINSRAEWLAHDKLQQARVSEGLFGPDTSWSADSVDELRSIVDTLLAAFVELFDGTIDPAYGQLVYGAESEDAHARMIPGGDWRVRKAEADARDAAETERLLSSPDQRSSFGPDANVTFIVPDGGTAGEG